MRHKPASEDGAHAPWLTAMTEYEGFPLALRVRPKADSPANRAAFPHLGIVTHQLARVRENGLPEADYNDSLEDFDLGLQAAIMGHGAGLVVLVETFAGKRNYYAYVADQAQFHDSVTAFCREFEEHQLNINSKLDPSWKLYSRYRKDFP